MPKNDKQWEDKRWAVLLARTVSLPPQSPGDLAMLASSQREGCSPLTQTGLRDSDV
jgi:hypothetical protein